MGKIKLILGASILIFSAVANASLISRDYLTHGDNLITFDTKTKLQWLDLTVTQGLSVDDVQDSHFISQEGFRYATRDDVTNLFFNAGITEWSDYTILTSQYDETSNLVDLIGATTTYPDGNRASIGKYGPFRAPIFGYASDWMRINILDTRYSAAPLGCCTPIPQSLAQPNVGSLLVRVPEPPAIALMLSGLLGLAFVRRRVRK